MNPAAGAVSSSEQRGNKSHDHAVDATRRDVDASLQRNVGASIRFRGYDSNRPPVIQRTMYSDNLRAVRMEIRGAVIPAQAEHARVTCTLYAGCRRFVYKEHMRYRNA